METAVPETSDKIDNCLSQEAATEVTESEVSSIPEEISSISSIPDEVNSDKNALSDKELSWEKIAAEIAAEEVEHNQTQTQIDATTESKKSTEIVEETVINTVTEEKIVTDTEVLPEQILNEPALAEEAESCAEPVEVSEELVAVPIAEEVAIPIVEEVAVPVDEAQTETLDDEVVEVPDTSEEKKEDTIISEVQDEENVESEDMEYTVLEAEEVETNEIIEEHLAQTNKGVETVVIINPDQSQTEITIEQVDDDDKIDEGESYSEEIYLMTKENVEEGDVDDPEEKPKPEKPKKQRGRKPISDIPLHVLGRDISKPTEGVSNGGRTMPKPRLGVKVPYRNLTSQIVSKQEIEKEIMDRFKLKQEQNVTNSGDILFARKLTQRLAKKLIPTEKDKTTKEEASSSVENNSDIKNNSDLLAILEGDGDDIDLTKQKEKEEEIKKSEREIALEQLRELPLKNKIYKKDEEKKESPKEKEKENPKEKDKESPKEKIKAAPPTSPVKEKSKIDLEPRLKTGMVLKTYTRKRRSTDLDSFLPPKKTIVAATPVKNEDGSSGNVYVTKSSRIIKRKVIWDPDEAPSKGPIKSPKLEVAKTPAKTVEKKEEKAKTVEKKEDKVIEKKIMTPKKIIKAPLIKKPKRLTEVDKLLMDEGAVNMLYDVKNNDESTPKKKTNKSMISLDRAHKELLSKANVIKNDLQQNKDVQKNLRKKEIVSPTVKKEVKREAAATPGAVTRKKSKDSARSSVHSPPSSPPYNAAEASRIIRRHSSSSFSSNDELDEDEEKSVKKKTDSIKKKAKKNAEKPKEVAKNNNNTLNESKANHVDKSVDDCKTFTVTKKNKLVSIKLLSVEGKCFFNDQMLKDLTSCLKEFEKDDDCHVVSIVSDNSESFCEGLDYRLLVVEDEGARKKKANEFALLVKEFLRCLLNFPKVLVAGIQGDCVGLGVTMLPLFDMVIASDTSTFSAPYSRLGCIPEAGFLLTVPHLSSNGLASELLYASQTMKADDAFRRGLVTRLCWPEKYQQEFKSLLLQVANQPRESIVATKQQLRQNIMQSTESALSSVSKVLVEYWTSPECQKNFAK